MKKKLNYILPVQCGAVDMAFLILNSKDQINNNNNNNNNIYKDNQNENINTNEKLVLKSFDKKMVKINKFASYLAGLFEGDGYIWIPSEFTIKKKKHNPMFALTFNKKDIPLAKKILEYFKLGHIIIRKQNSIELRITSIKSLLIVIELINGKLRTPKIDQLYKLID